MKTQWRVVWAAGFLTLVLASSAGAEQTAVVKGNRVNVRGQAGLVGEVITQLNAGETVTVIEQITLDQPQPGEPAEWSKIKLPEGTTVWVFEPFIDAATKKVKASRLNLRGGPSEAFSILGRIERGTVVKEVRTEKSWMEIEPPAQTFAFVASSLLEIVPTLAEGPAPTAEIVEFPVPDTEGTETTPAEPTAEIVGTPLTTETTEPLATQPDLPPTEFQMTPPPEEEIVVTAEEDFLVTAGGPPSLPEIVLDPDAEIETEVEVPVEPPPPRIVSREGLVVLALTIQAPTPYLLQSVDTRRKINWLHTESIGLRLKNFAGRKVIVTGEELIDPRWPNTPILDVEQIQLAP